MYSISPCWDITTFWPLVPFLAAVQVNFNFYPVLRYSECTSSALHFLMVRDQRGVPCRHARIKSNTTGQQQPKAGLHATAIFFLESLIFNTITYVILLDTCFSSTFFLESCKVVLLNYKIQVTDDIKLSHSSYSKRMFASKVILHTCRPL